MFRQSLPEPEVVMTSYHVTPWRTPDCSIATKKSWATRRCKRLRQLAAGLAGKRIVHVNSTKTGGGVAEILGWMVPMMEELGIDARWEVISGPPDFYRVTKAFHNGLQGLPVALTAARFRSAPRR